MNGLQKNGLTLTSIGLALGVSAGAVTLEGCDDGGGLCGPCGSVAEGSVGISGNAQLDGFFKAVADLDAAIGTVDANFNAEFRALADAWGHADLVGEGDISADVVAQVMAEIEADIAAAVEGGISISYAPPECSANVNVAVEAQARCEAQAGCDVDVDPGMVAVECEGTCEGTCSGECSGAVSCQVAGGISCSGTCNGTCELEAAAECEGTCNGTCNGTCQGELSNEGGQARCEGKCEGTCEGTCELSAGGSCEGTCHGECVTETPSAECMAEATCSGSCEGECSGSCKGEATPPSASAECEASADCQASASAQASANVECTPPSLEMQFEYAAALAGDIGAQAEFRAKINALRVHGAAILQGFARLRGLIDGDFGGGVMVEPPLVQIRTSIEGIIDAGISGDIDVPAGRIQCVIPAMRDSVTLLGEFATNAAGTLEAQARFSASLFTSIGG